MGYNSDLAAVATAARESIKRLTYQIHVLWTETLIQSSLDDFIYEAVISIADGLLRMVQALSCNGLRINS